MAHQRSSTKNLLLPTLLAAGAAAFIVGRTSRPVGNPRVPQPAKPVDLQRYLGRWYELARYEAGFEHNCEGVTAEYTLQPDGILRIVNTCREGSPDGRARSSRGKAKVVADTDNAKFKVAFFGALYLGNYWVMDHADDYRWSIVGEPSGKYLWILHREPTPPDDVKAALIQRARDLGYDTTMIRQTLQPPA